MNWGEIESSVSMIRKLKTPFKDILRWKLGDKFLYQTFDLMNNLLIDHFIGNLFKRLL